MELHSHHHQSATEERGRELILTISTLRHCNILYMSCAARKSTPAHGSKRKGYFSGECIILWKMLRKMGFEHKKVNDR